MFPDVQKAREALEQTFMQTVKATPDTASSEALQQQSHAAAQEMMATWTRLFQYLVVRHLDMATKKVEESGALFAPFKKTANGIAEPPVRPGYPEAFRKKIVEETGEKYLMP